jgi:hypothetical protein
LSRVAERRNSSRKGRGVRKGSRGANPKLTCGGKFYPPNDFTSRPPCEPSVCTIFKLICTSKG